MSRFFQSCFFFFTLWVFPSQWGCPVPWSFTMNAKFNIVPLCRATSSVIWRPCRGGDSQIRVHKAGGIANNELTMKDRAPRCLSTARLLSVLWGTHLYIFLTYLTPCGQSFSSSCPHSTGEKPITFYYVHISQDSWRFVFPTKTRLCQIFRDLVITNLRQLILKKYFNLKINIVIINNILLYN